MCVSGGEMGTGANDSQTRCVYVTRAREIVIFALVSFGSREHVADLGIWTQYLGNDLRLIRKSIGNCCGHLQHSISSHDWSCCCRLTQMMYCQIPEVGPIANYLPVLLDIEFCLQHTISDIPIF